MTRSLAFKEGFCDAVLGRECKSPYTAGRFKRIRANADYLDGYLNGEEQMKPKYKGDAA